MCELCILQPESVLTDDWGRGACEEAVVTGRCATAASLAALGGVNLAKNSSSQLKNMFLSSGERFDQSISVSDDGVSGLEISGRA